MPAFVLIFEDILDFQVDPAVRAVHVDYLKSLGEQAIVAGPTFGEDQKITGRVVVADFPSLEDARAFAAEEPLVKAGRVLRWRVSSMAIVQKDGVFTPLGG